MSFCSLSPSGVHRTPLRVTHVTNMPLAFIPHSASVRSAAPSLCDTSSQGRMRSLRERKYAVLSDGSKRTCCEQEPLFGLTKLSVRRTLHGLLQAPDD